jgi:hypothetical protein
MAHRPVHQIPPRMDCPNLQDPKLRMAHPNRDALKDDNGLDAYWTGSYHHYYDLCGSTGRSGHSTSSKGGSAAGCFDQEAEGEGDEGGVGEVMRRGQGKG